MLQMFYFNKKRCLRLKLTTGFPQTVTATTAIGRWLSILLLAKHFTSPSTVKREKLFVEFCRDTKIFRIFVFLNYFLKYNK